ncbi:MAG: YajD family HNH nuclease [Chloroflexota bacterium]|nr:YajD family HNH nuclease [Chloroflexota bacterium]
MSPKKPRSDSDKLAKIIAEARQRENTYRERALKMYPWVCGRCGREFKGERIRELTVHHIDHDHNNNPPDGSNWELLCLYCHENEHSGYLNEGWHNQEVPGSERTPRATFSPFANLKDLLNEKE